jgi:N-acetylglucosaminyl-diphospho-decaprenol L-rhamnosyltransferase
VISRYRVGVLGAAGQRPQVDVGVVTWNTRDLTVTALRRLLDTDQDCTIRLLVHDNASSDGTAEAVREQVPEAEVEECPDNLGFAAGVNRLLMRSDTEFFLTLNSDAWPAPGAIGAMLGAARRHPRAAAVGPRLERPDGTLEHSTHPFPAPRIALAAAIGLHGRWAEERALPGAWRHDRERVVDWAVGAALLMRREAIEDIGGFDESFFMYVEDLEWGYRARTRGWETWFTPDALVVHVGNASGEQRYGASRTATWLANTYRFYARHHGPIGTAAYRSANALGATLVAGRAALHGERDRAKYWSRQVPAHFKRG